MVYVVLPEVVDGKVPQHIHGGRGVEGIQDHTPEDEKSGRLGVNASGDVPYVGSGAPCEEWVVVP